MKLEDFWRMSSPLQCSNQGQLEQFAQHHVQLGFEYLQVQKFHNLSGQPCPCLTALTGDKFFLCLSAFSYTTVHAVSCPFSRSHWEKPGLIYFTSPFTHWWSSPESFIFLVEWFHLFIILHILFWTYCGMSMFFSARELQIEFQVL